MRITFSYARCYDMKNRGVSVLDQGLWFASRVICPIECACPREWLPLESERTELRSIGTHHHGQTDWISLPSCVECTQRRDIWISMCDAEALRWHGVLFVGVVIAGLVWGGWVWEAGAAVALPSSCHWLCWQEAMANSVVVARWAGNGFRVPGCLGRPWIYHWYQLGT